MRIDLHETAKILENADKILLLCHSHPDGDTLGSAYALARALLGMGKRVRVECSDPIPKDFSFMLEGIETDDFEPELIAAIDVADIKLLGKESEGKYTGKIGLCIDHHGSNMLYADKVCLEADSASTAEIIYLLLKIMQVDPDPVIASCLFTGVSTDTGCFRFSNTTVRTFEIAAELAKLGADTYNIIQVFFETKTKTYAALERLALDSMRFYFSDRCALICVTQDMYKRSGSNESETDRLANLPRQIEGVLVGVTMRELKDGSFKASVRTHGDIDASAICKRLGGGGHMGAAGCTLYGSKQQAINSLLKEVQAEIDAVTIV
ncbi:MAG: bifunctional oligoribonuclease/PAP phosphatase NrnA [Oscillospiraceae bacterium]|nr:bifunctional oligoribonuclease/PAP phosphatase NrnA [Clostridiaceae bacterium]MDO4496060.1 bifunctional oligoribonuclease/PAP phosphatase NrnA [Clostridiaceae bacterium]MDY5948273.1 bifunctional oligoribonuclease/PAP phosphatase NrnA [Oscillospiraceae bacterium]